MNNKLAKHHLAVVVVVGYANDVVADIAWPDDDMVPFHTAVVHGDVQHSWEGQHHHRVALTYNLNKKIKQKTKSNETLRLCGIDLKHHVHLVK